MVWQGQGLGRGYGIGGIAEVTQTTAGVGASGTVSSMFWETRNYIIQFLQSSN